MEKAIIWINKNRLYIIIGLFLFITFVQYFGLIFYKYPVPPGDDPINHLRMARPYYDGTGNFFQSIRNGAYPPLYHLVIAKTALLFNIDLLSTIKLVYPSLIIIASLSIFLLVWSVAGVNAAIGSTFAYGILARTPLQLLNDGGYPNIIASHILIPLGFFFYIIFFKSKKIFLKIIFMFLALFSLSAVPLTHHISTFYLIILVNLFLLITIFLSWISKRWSNRKSLLMFALYIIFFLVLSRLYIDTNIFASAKNLSSVMIQVTTDFPFLKILSDYSNMPGAIWPLLSIPGHLGKLLSIIIVMALPGFFILYIKSRDYLLKLFLMTVATWAGILIIGSQMKFLSNPERLARDSAVPLTILCGICLPALISAISRKYIRLVIIVILSLVFSYGAFRRTEIALSHEPMVRITKADIDIIDRVRNYPPGKILIKVPNAYFTFFLPEWWIGYDYGANHDTALFRGYDYIYVADQQTGWVPAGTILDSAQYYQDNIAFDLVDHKTSSTNSVYLFKVVK